MLLLAGISYAIYQVTAPDTIHVETTKAAKPQDTKGDHDAGMYQGDTQVTVEAPPEPQDWPWMPIISGLIGGLTGLISALAALLSAIAALRRRRKSP